MDIRPEIETTRELDLLAINTIRFLAVDMVEKANSGHPGTPMALAPLAYWMWTRHLRHNPADPAWPDRDRFVLSCGHACALLYSLLHLCGYGLAIEELQRFRQWGSRAPGHPERGVVPGVEVTTGPLGQGISNAVGMAIAGAKAGAAFNRDGFPLFNHRIWVLASDGDMMEGISGEASSFAGHQRLAQLKVFYDDNHITIDGPTSLAFSEDVGKRYEAYGWRVEHLPDINDLDAVAAMMSAVEAETERPSLVVVRSVIAYGSPHKHNTSEAHGAPLGADEVLATKRNLGWPTEPTFLVPPEIRPIFDQVRQRGAALEDSWQKLFTAYRGAFPEVAATLENRLAGKLPQGWDKAIPTFSPSDKPIATRAASGKVLNAIAPVLPELIGGSADLAPSNDTLVKGQPDFEAGNPEGRNFHFGVREHAMGAILNGIWASGLWLPYGGTFLIFSDYMRGAIRLAAVMEAHVIYVFTHDSVFLGEDGPTHQPISQLAGLRAIPHLTVLRPADACETAAAWKIAIEHQGPVALVLTRQALPILAATAERAAEGVAKGGYVLIDAPGGDPDLVLLATGSEVPLICEAAGRLTAQGVKVRVVSMPCWSLFERQSKEYRAAVLPPACKHRLAVEAASPFGWDRYIGPDGDIIALDHFGASAPAKVIATEFGFTPENVVERALRLLAR